MTSSGPPDFDDVDPRLAELWQFLEEAIQLATEADALGRMSEITFLCRRARAIAEALVGE